MSDRRNALPWHQRLMQRAFPRYFLNRLKARARASGITEARNAYDAAKRSRRTQYWRRAGDDANSVIATSNAALRFVSRDMVRNSPYARRIKQAIVTNVVGAGILPQIKRVKGQRQQARIEELVEQHLLTTDIDADGCHDLYGLQALIMGTVVEAGECLVRRRRRRSTDGYALPFQLQVLEPDFLDDQVDGKLANGNIAVQGIEFDKRGRRVAYWLHKEHPGSAFAVMQKSTRVRSEDIAHIFWKDRPGQARGVTWFHPIIQRLRDFADFIDAQLVRQKIAACFAAFIIGSDDEPEDEGDGDTRYPVEAFEPGMIERLDAGESVEFSTPPGVTDFDGYTVTTMHEIATGVGVPYSVVTGDLRRANFASGRLGWLEFQRNIEQWRKLMIMPMGLHKIGGWFREAVQLQTGYFGPLQVAWVAPRREMINPKEEISADSQEVRAGFVSRSHQIRKRGGDPLEVEREIAEENKRADEAGFKFDTDPRKQSAQGQEQPSAGEDNDASDPGNAEETEEGEST